MPLNRLSEQSVQQLTSDQVATSLHAVIKELNSLDAGATNVEIRIQGLQQLSVKDNGSGISIDDCHQMAQRHFTSKLRDLSDLDNLDTYGFRGEALHSVCNLSASVSITTRTANDPVGNIFRLDRSGKVLEQRPTACQVGTTISIDQLFDRMPVRRQEAEKSWSASIKIITDMLVSYGLIHPQIRLSMRYERERKSAPSTWQKAPATQSIDVLKGIYGAPFAGNFQTLELHGLLDVKDGSHPDSLIHITAVLPRAEAELNAVLRSAKDRCFVFVNKRPVEMPSVNKIIREAVNRLIIPPSLSGELNSKRHPCFIVDIAMDSCLFDVNVEPAKNVIFMHNQEGFDKLVERLLRENYSPLNESPPSLTSLSEPVIEDFSVIETAAAIDETAIEAADQLAADINSSFMGTEEWARGDIKGLESGAEILTVGSKIGTAAIADSSNENENDNLVSAATPRSTFQILMEAGKRKPTEPKLNPEFRQSLPVEKSLRHTLVEEFPQAKHQHQEKSTFRNRFDNNNLMINISDGSFSQQQPKTKQIKLDNFLPAKTTSAPPGHKPNLANKCLLDTTSIITRFDAWLRMQSQPRPEFHSLKQKNEKLDASNAKLIGTIKTDQDEKEFLSVFKVPAAYVEQNYHLAIVSHRAIAKTRCIDNLIKLHWLPITREFNDELHVLGRESYSTHHWDCLLTFAESPVMIANGFKLEIIDENRIKVCAICDAVDGYGIDDIPELLDLFANVDPRIFDQPGINGDYESCDAYLDCSVLRHPKVVSHLRYEASRVYQIETTAPRILTDLNQKSIALL